MAGTYTEESPYRISPSDALYPAIYVQLVAAIRQHMAAKGPMWIMVHGTPARQYANIDMVKKEMCRVLYNNVEAEGDEKKYIDLMSK